MKENTKKSLVSIIVAVGITVVFLVMGQVGLFELWQERLSDRLFLDRRSSEQIVIIAIDDKSLQKVGRWPWDREIMAKLLQKLTDAAVIGIDVSYFEPSSPSSDQKLADQLSKYTKIVLAEEADNLYIKEGRVFADNLLKPLPIFGRVTSVGVVNVIIDPDGVVRRLPLAIYDSTGSKHEIFAFQVLKQYLPGDIFSKLPEENNSFRINFTGRPGSFQTVSLVDILEGNFPNDKFKGKILLVGATAPDLHDSNQTPVSVGQPMNGVEIHANAIQTLLEQKYLVKESFVAGALISLFTALVLALMVYRSGVVVGSVVLVLGLLAFFVYAFVSFDKGIIRNLIFPLLSMSTVYISSIIYKYLYENKQKMFIKKAFSYYLSAEVMQDVLAHPQKLVLGGIRKEITVLFSDIENFTAISERLEPEVLSGLLNRYLTVMTNIVFENKGVLDKYIGDSVMAFWGAPLDNSDHALLACQTGLQMQERMQQINTDWNGHGIENFNIRIGINTGMMVVGNMGSNIRFDYTVLGDNVNLGSRLEGLNKEYGTSILISKTTFDLVKDQFTCRLVDVVAVKGKTKGVQVYELRHQGVPEGDEQLFLDRFDKARRQYLKGQFKKALADFEKLQVSYPYDKICLVYIQRCKDLVKTSPKIWDGVYHARNK